jgi:hypothetical protein
MMDIREELANLEHQQWAHWTQYMLDNLTPENIERWRRQIDTPYSELSEKEKASDRNWADKVLALVNKPIEVRLKCERCGECTCYGTMTEQGLHFFKCPSVCTCDNGERVHRVMWEYADTSQIEGNRTCRNLMQADLVDPDVAIGYAFMHEEGMKSFELSHNKGTLRLQEAGR